MNDVELLAAMEELRKRTSATVPTSIRVPPGMMIYKGMMLGDGRPYWVGEEESYEATDEEIEAVVNELGKLIGRKP